MQLLHKDHIQKSRAFGLLLFSFFFCLTAEANDFYYSSNDTIILGGKKLIVEREVTYDSTSTSTSQELDPEKKRSRLKLGTWRVGFDVAGYAPIDAINSQVDGYSSLNAFVGPDRRRGSGASVGGHAERAIGRNGLMLNAGLSIDFINGFNYTLNESQLEDSLLAFASFNKNELSQILLFRYDIGSETDTIQTPLDQEAIQSTWLRIPLGLCWERELSRSFYLRFGLFADLRLHLSGNNPNIYLLPDRGNEIEVYQTSRVPAVYRPFTITPRFSAGGRWAMDRRWWFVASLNGGFPFTPMKDTEQVQYRSILTHVGLGVQYHLGR